MSFVEYTIRPEEWRNGAVCARLEAADGAPSPARAAAAAFCRAMRASPRFVATSATAHAGGAVCLVAAGGAQLVSVQFFDAVVRVLCAPALGGALVHEFPCDGRVPRGVYRLLGK